MNRHCATLLLSCAAACAGAEPPPVSPESIRAHVEFLADDLLEGRAAGTRGYDLAARYVVGQMRLIGLEPAGDGGGWYQEMALLEAVRDHSAAKLAVHRAGGEVALTPLDDFLPGFWFYGPESAVTAPATFVGHGIQAPELGHDDLAGVDLTGRIAVVLAGAPASFPDSQRAHYSGRNKTDTLAARGAVGVVTVDTPEEDARVPWAKKKRASWNPRMRLLDDAGEPVDANPEIRGSAAVSTAAAERLFAGATMSAAEAFAAAHAGRSRSFELPGEISIALDNALSCTRSANVVGLLRGSDPALAGEYVVFTAHLDHIGRGAAVDGDDIYNGALDNASGVAVMLETARALAASPVKPRRSVLFVALTAEERGLLGAYRFVARPTVPREAIVANVNTDMPSAIYPLAGVTLYGAAHSTLGDTAREALAAEGFVETPDPAPEEVTFIRSDQYPFVRAGIPAIYPDVGALSSDPSVDAAAALRQFLLTHYHMPSDSAALPIHWPSLARLARFEARLALAIANGDARPAWLPGDFFGATFGKPRPAAAAD